MLEPDEFAEFSELRRAGMHAVGVPIEERYRAALEFYERVTGFHEANINAASHHAVELVGPPCERCGKVLRTPTASRCLLCGAVRAPGPWAAKRHVPLEVPDREPNGGG